MPPWLAQYEDDDLAGLNYLPEESMLSATPFQKDGTTGNNNNNNNNKKEMSDMQRLELALNGFFPRHSPAAGSSSVSMSAPDAISHFAPSEIYDILDAVRVASRKNVKLMEGCADFLYLMLTLEEEGVLTSDFLSGEPWDDDFIGRGDNDGDSWDDYAKAQQISNGHHNEPHSIMTKDVLVAAAFHYCDCVRARRLGLYDYARRAMEASLDRRIWEELEEKQQLLFLPAAANKKKDDEIEGADTANKAISPFEDTSIVMMSPAARGTSSEGSNRPIDKYGEESLTIATGAARLKKAEIMSSIVRSNKRTIHRSNKDENNDGDDAEILRSFLVSLSEDWRALVIRGAACLYRLKGIASEQEYAGGAGAAAAAGLSATAVRTTAKEAFRVYAPLAQRLGMQRLKTELENTAFRILYPKQYSVASSLYDIEEMKGIVLILSSRMEQLLRSDPVFHGQLEDLAVTSRVKEPYSLWRKLLRYRFTAAATEEVGPNRQAALSMKWVPDAIALRVVLSARSQSSLEDEESLRTREKMLCYYALQLISDVWPASSSNVAKDYIKNPKPNGYQSLHYTASLTISGQEWPFEVQIRSEEMHRIAEFGVAAHWDYKLQTKVIKSLPETTGSSEESPIPALPAAGNCTIIASEEESSATAEVNYARDTSDDSLSARKKGRVASYIEALTTSRETLVQNNRFIFVSATSSALDGKMVSIDPSASSIADVIDEYGGNCRDGELEVFLNGVRCHSLVEELSNGDVLTLRPR